MEVTGQIEEQHLPELAKRLLVGPNIWYGSWTERKWRQINADHCGELVQIVVKCAYVSVPWRDAATNNQNGGQNKQSAA